MSAGDWTRADLEARMSALIEEYAGDKVADVLMAAREAMRAPKLSLAQLIVAADAEATRREARAKEIRATAETLLKPGEMAVRRDLERRASAIGFGASQLRGAIRAMQLDAAE